MAMSRAVALCCAVLLAVSQTSGYTVDCNQEYTDCDTELSKVTDDDELPTAKIASEEILTSTTTTLPITTTTTNTPSVNIENKTESTTETAELQEQTEEIKPKPRLLNLNVDELQNFANALHNETEKSNKKLTDLSDVNLDDEEDDSRLPDHQHNKDMSDKFFANLQAPFQHLISVDREIDECIENGAHFKIGEKVDRGCEESCECMPGGIFECSPRCKHPYIRRGRQLDDPLCFESPVDECCSIIACATGNGETVPGKMEVCKYGNETYSVGSRWHRGCEQTCFCENNSVVSCTPRCKPIMPSEKCISVQDPSDACCKVQVCDVSQDVHELPENVTTSSTTTTDEPSTDMPSEYIQEQGRTSNTPISAEPIGSIKVLQNNSVQVNLIHPNNTEDPIHLLLSDDGGKTFKDVELIYSNLILNLEGGKDYILKTKETDTKFNFTITSSDAGLNEVEGGNTTKIGCWYDGKFYGVGEEYRIGCTELCECTGRGTSDCAALVCPNHVGLEIMSKGCVKWAPSPPAHPPNCCPRSARCLSDGTCHYNGVPVPNWSEVPISLTGCEQRCFCENGDLDCQEVCTPLPPVPPQTLRCPPLHRPAAVNISDDDCCKQWGCLPNNGSDGSYSEGNKSIPISTRTENISLYPQKIAIEATTTYPAHTLTTTDSSDIFKELKAFQSFPKFPKLLKPVPVNRPVLEMNNTYNSQDNITVFNIEDTSERFETIQAEPPLVVKNYFPPPPTVSYQAEDPVTVTAATIVDHGLVYPKKVKLKLEDVRNTSIVLQSSSNRNNLDGLRDEYRTSITPKPFNYFFPINKNNEMSDTQSSKYNNIFFEPDLNNKSDYILTRAKNYPYNSVPNNDYSTHSPRGKIVTVLKSKDVRPPVHSYWGPDMDSQILTKQPNTFETVLLRPVLSPKVGVSSTLKQFQVPGKSYSSLELETLLNQMQLHLDVNRNLGRSTDKNQGSTAVPQSPVADYPPQFVPPEINYPHGEVPDYEQNNIHRPLPPGLSGIPGLPPGLQVPSSFGDMNKKLTVISIEADSPTSITMLLGLPPVLVGLRGSVDLRYTDKADEDVSHWYSQVFAPADEILTTPRLEFRLTGLRPSTTYKVKGKLHLHNLPVSPESDTYNVRTLDIPTPVLPIEEKRRDVLTGLAVVDVNDTTAHVTWRRFTEEELQFIDGIQVRYRPVGTPIYSMTELLHHSRSTAELHDLRPGSRYEASLVLIPPPRATTELIDPSKIEFSTLDYIDPYNWTVTVEARSIGAEQAELTWHGVPSPAERWVRVYRAAHTCGDVPGKEHDQFRLASRDQPYSVTLSGLQPETKCRVWLELFLTNGKIKTSNVLEINTKSLDTDNPIDNEIEASSVAGRRGGARGDYYSALVGVGVVAALGALTSLLLLLVVVRRHRPRSVPITPVPSAPRESSLPPYDNPAYKLELQQETMDL